MQGSSKRAPTLPVEAVRRARELLGVAADADPSQLTRAYWQQARRLHPDLSHDPDAPEQFRALHAAYQLALRSALHTPPPAPQPHVQHHGSTPVTDLSTVFGAGPVSAVSGAAGPNGARANTTSPSTPGPHGTAGRGATSAATAGPGNGVWVVAGPVHVQPPWRHERMESAPEGQP